MSKTTALLTTVRRTLAERALFVGVRHVLVACSGGPDSVALAHVLLRLRSRAKIEVTVASVDHGLRPESARELEFVQTLAEQWKVPFAQRALALRVDAGQSVQSVARTARYAALRALACERGADCVATGHTQDDQAETVLGRLLRGASWQSLAAIQPRREDGVVRPLIDCTRKQVETHLTHHGLPCVRDPSNADLRYQRPLLRRMLTEQIAPHFPRARHHLARLADEVAVLRASMAAQSLEHAKALAGRPVLDLVELQRLEEPLRQEVLRRWLRSTTLREPGRAHLYQIAKAIAGSDRAEIWLGGGWMVKTREGTLVCSKDR